jgi:haloalkane dehalogenase
LPGGMLRTLSEDEMEHYRAPYREREARLPTLIWPRQIPIDGEPADVAAIAEAYGRWLSESQLAKLFIAGDPGAIISVGGGAYTFCRAWPNQDQVVVKGRHFLQEDSSAEIGAALRKFVADVCDNRR